MNIKSLYTGRVNRRQYLNGMLFLIVTAWIFTGTIFYLISGSVGETQNVQAMTSFIITPFTLGLVIKRLHDIGSSGKIYVIYFFLSFIFSLLFPTVAKDIFTLLNFGIGITILLTPGETKSNRYGEVPSKLSLREIIFGKKESRITPLKPQEIKVERAMSLNDNIRKHSKTAYKIPLTIIVGVVILLLAGLFYWFEYRPSKIKRECSWVEERSEAIPYRPSMNRDEMVLNGILEDCDKETFANNPMWNNTEKIELENRLCEAVNESKVKEYSVEQEAIPSKSWWRKATTREYEFCLHSKGL